jgi:hypothetical protein
LTSLISCNILSHEFVGDGRALFVNEITGETNFIGVALDKTN